MFIGLKFNYNIHLKTIKSILTTVCIGSNGSFTSLINNFLRSLITLFNTFIYLISIFFYFTESIFRMCVLLRMIFLALVLPSSLNSSRKLFIVSVNLIYGMKSSRFFPLLIFRSCSFDAAYWTCWDNEMKNVYSKEMVTFILFRRRYDRLPVRAI